MIWILLHLEVILWTLALGIPCAWTAFYWWREGRRQRREAQEKVEMDARTRRTIINMFHRRARQEQRDYADSVRKKRDERVQG